MESVVRFVLTHRRLLSAALVGLSVWAGVTAITHTPDTRPVLVAARDLANGDTVTTDDVETRRVPEAAVPAGTLTATDVTGRALSGAMRSGEVFTDRRVVDPRDLGPGRSLAVVEVAGATGDVMRAGDTVDILAVGESAEAIATSVEVVTVRVDEDRDAAVLGIVAPPRIAAALARASATSRLAAVVVARA